MTKQKITKKYASRELTKVLEVIQLAIGPGYRVCLGHSGDGAAILVKRLVPLRTMEFSWKSKVHDVVNGVKMLEIGEALCGYRHRVMEHLVPSSLIGP